jgi:hypothetical protein
MESFNRGTRASDSLNGGNKLNPAALDLFNAPLDLGCPGFLDFVILEEAGKQPVRELYPLLRGELKRLSFYDFELT